MHNQPREPRPYDDCQAKSIQEFGWTSQGMDWGWGQGIKSTTHRRVKEFGYSCHQISLTWAKKKKNWTVAQWSKVLFSDESKFCISFGNQGPRVWRKGGEAHSPSCLKSSVKFPQSVMIWVQCHLLCWSIVFFENQRHCTLFTKTFLEHFMLPSADQLFKDADFIPAGFGSCPHCQKHQKLVKWPWCWCAWLVSKLTRPEPIENLCCIVKRKMRNSYHLSSATNWSPPCHAELRQ